jgi:hypothetical protein
MIDSISTLYDNLVQNNSIEDVNDILPAMTFNLLATHYAENKNYNIKLMLDELRMYVYNLDDTNSNISPLEIMKQTKQNIRFLPRLNDISSVNSTTNSAFLSYALCFVNSTMLLYITPCKSGQFGGKQLTMSEVDPSSDYYVDPLPFSMDLMYQTSQNNTELINMFQSFEDGEPIPDVILQKMKQLCRDV